MPAENTLASASEPLSGRLLLGRYRIVRPLARGGMGVVYLGRVEGASGFAKPVVIKMMLSNVDERDEGAQLFAREARIVSQLQHPGIVAVVDFGKTDSAHAMVLEYVHGYNLGQWFRYATEARGGVPLPYAVHVILGVLDALAYAHELARPDGTALGIIHRDISPGNILLDLQGRVRLTDFGIARTADDEFKTREGMFRGTLPFSAPEALHSGPVDGRCDEYACGVVLYQLLTGVHPFRTGDTAQTMVRILTYDPPPISTLCPDVPPAIARAVEKAMARDPEERFATVAEFAEALRGAATWSERDAAESFAAQVERDFTGDMPALMQLEPLSVRDASWREAQEAPEPARVALSSSPPEMKSAITKRPVTAETDATTVGLPKARTEAAPAERNAWLWPAVAALGVVTAAATVLILAFRPPADTPQKLLVVEKRSVADETESPPAPTPDGKPAAPEAVAGVDSARPAAVVRSPAPKASAGRGAPLGLAFQRQEARIQRCFQQSPESLEGAPRLSVKFDVDRAGHVAAATVSPASVAAQPLGQCILAIARSTEFGAQPEPVSFSIPIAARMVRR